MNAWNAAEINDFRGPLDLTSAAMVLVDSDDAVIGWSESARNLFGYPADEIVGQPLGTLLVGWPEQPQGPAEPLGRPLGPRCWSEERIARHRAGHTLGVATTLCALTDGERGPARVLVAAALEPLRAWESHQAMLHGLATQSPIGLGLYDTDLRVTWTNATYEREMGQPLNEFAGRRVGELYARGQVLSDGYPGALEDVMRGVLETGEPVLGLIYRGRPPSDPDHDHVWSCAYYPLHDSHGHVLGVCEDALDITGRYRAEQRLALTVRAGVRIGTTLDMTTTAREVAEVVVPGFADTVTVDLAEGVLEGEEPAQERGRPPSLMRVAERTTTAHAGGARTGGERGEGGDRAGRGGGAGREGAFDPYPVRYSPGSPQSAALSSGEPVSFEGGGSGYEERSGDGGAGGDNGEPGDHCVLAVPLRARGIVMGLVSFLRSRNPTPFDNGELTLANELATRASLSIDNARRYARERAASLTLQRSLLPHGLPDQSAVEVAHRYLPADVDLGVGGDFFDVIALSGMRVGLAVGDVVGHGVHAAATMGRLRSTVRALARMDLTPDELIAHLDDLALQAAEEEGTAAGPTEDPGLGVACLYMVYDPVSRRCTAARAGHPPPAYVDPDGRFSLLDIPPGPPLGVGGLPFE
jgi:PAS domain S-box-containing protein